MVLCFRYVVFVRAIDRLVFFLVEKAQGLIHFVAFFRDQGTSWILSVLAASMPNEPECAHAKLVWQDEQLAYRRHASASGVGHDIGK